MKSKLIICILMMISIMSLSLMTGCGSNSAAAEGNDQTDVQPSDVPPADTADIGEAKVKEIIIDKVPGAAESSIYEFEREIDDGRIQYEGSLYHDGYEYEFEVDGATGTVLQWEIDD